MNIYIAELLLGNSAAWRERGFHSRHLCPSCGEAYHVSRQMY
jgi:hypothetical protein